MNSALADHRLAPLQHFLARQAQIGLLRFLTCGSVDDGKSTLIGRLLYDTKQIFDDQLATLDRDSAATAPPARTSTSRCWSTGWRPSASRASPSTSPTASSPPTSAASSSPTRPATSSTRATWRPAPPTPSSPWCWSTRGKGVLTQTRRHAFIASLMGIRHVVLAVNKIDLVDFREARFSAIRDDYRRRRRGLGFRTQGRHPDLGALRRQRDRTSARTPWYGGPSLLASGGLDVDAAAAVRPFRMPVQWVNRPDRFPRLRRHRRHRHAAPRRPGAVAAPAAADGCAHRHHGRRPRRAGAGRR